MGRTLLEELCRMTFSVTDVCIESGLVEQGKDKTVRKSASLKRPIGTVIATRFHIVYIDTIAFLFMVR